MKRDMYYVVLGEQIATFRKARKYTQQELADRLKVSRETVSSWEKGRREPNIKEVDMIADVLGTTSEELCKKSQKYLFKEEYL